jgi:catalase (peroxidase I)
MRDQWARLDFTDRDIVAIMGAHTVGRSAPERTNFAAPRFGTQYTDKVIPGCGAKAHGGMSWTPNWTMFNNELFINIVASTPDPDLLMLEPGPDHAIRDDPGFAQFAKKYAESQDAFFADYETAHKKMSDAGVQWMPSFPVAFKIGA